MNGRVAKKIRKYTKRNFIEYATEVRKWSFVIRWRFCWYILFHREPKARKLSKQQVMQARKPIEKGATGQQI